jgi:N-acetylmuramoyl-L-alanine amidase
MKIALIPGHGPSIDQGAENKDGTTELAWNRDLVRRIKSHLDGRAEVVVINRVRERLSPVAEINATQAQVALEFHLNASNGKASGTEMIYISRAGRIIAEKLLNAAVGVLRLPNRGVKQPFAGRGNFFLTKTRMPAVIVESFFIDNSEDLEVGNARKEELALAYALALVPIPTHDA